MELPNPLSAEIVGSFPYFTVKDRLPVILTSVIDLLCREKLNVVDEYGEAASEEVKAVIAMLSQLKNEMQTNKPLKLLPLLESPPQHDDTAQWNKCIAAHQREGGQAPRWFTSPWLLVECYLYKCIHHSFLCTTTMKTLDPFLKLKVASLRQSKTAVAALEQFTLALLKEVTPDTPPHLVACAVTAMLELCVWGNQCDLSISGGASVAGGPADDDDVVTAPATISGLSTLARTAQFFCAEGDRPKTAADSANPAADFANSTADSANPAADSANPTADSANDRVTDGGEVLESTEDSNEASKTSACPDSSVRLLQWLCSSRENFLVNESPRVCEVLQAASAPHRSVALVLDNAGYELLTDVCLSLLLLRAGVAHAVHAYVKTRPWFVSDTTAADVDYTLQWLSLEGFTGLAKAWRAAMTSQQWQVKEDAYWTTHESFRDMMTSRPDLYQELSKATLVIFKGDLNYRKLVGDLNWPPTTPFPTALGPDLARLGPIVALRTVKGGPAVGATEGQLEKVKQRLGDPDWATKGGCGMVQFSVP